MRRALGRVVGVSALGVVALVGTGGAVLAATPQTPGPPPGSPEQMAYFADTCRHEMQRPPIGGVEKLTSPRPGEAGAGGRGGGKPSLGPGRTGGTPGGEGP